jgi:hypothetical protein
MVSANDATAPLPWLDTGEAAAHLGARPGTLKFRRHRGARVRAPTDPSSAHRLLGEAAKHPHAKQDEQRA